MVPVAVIIRLVMFSEGGNFRFDWMHVTKFILLNIFYKLTSDEDSRVTIFHLIPNSSSKGALLCL